MEREELGFKDFIIVVFFLCFLEELMGFCRVFEFLMFVVILIMVIRGFFCCVWSLGCFIFREGSVVV